MIPGGVVMVAGYLLIYGALLVGGVLLTWWLWRQWRAFQGRPRRALPGWALLLVVIVSVYPIFIAVTLGSITLSDMQHERQEMRWKKRRNVELSESRPYGEITLPAGTVLNRIEHQIPGTEDSPISLDGVTQVRLPHPQTIAGAPTIAFHPAPATLELAQDHEFSYADGEHKGEIVTCEAGWLVVFDAPAERELETDLWEFGLPAAFFQPSRWRFKNCFSSSPIRVVILRHGTEMVVP